MRYRLWIASTGSVVPMHIIDDRPEELARLESTYPQWTFQDFATLADLQAVLPADRSRRDAWRFRGGKIVEDLSIPPPSHPRQALLDQVTQATTVAQLKALLLRIVDQGL